MGTMAMGPGEAAMTGAEGVAAAGFALASWSCEHGCQRECGKKNKRVKAGDGAAQQGRHAATFPRSCGSSGDRLR